VHRGTALAEVVVAWRLQDKPVLPFLLEAFLCIVYLEKLARKRPSIM